MESVEDKYGDILSLPYRKSTRHPHMSLLNRAAQFSPFAALTGHEAAIQETARLTDMQIELEESEKACIDRTLQRLADSIHQHPVVTVIYFQPDATKAGGAYLTKTGPLKKIDTYERCLVFDDRSTVSIDSIYALSGVAE